MHISISPTVKVSSYFCLHFHTIYWADPELPSQTLTAARPKRRLPTGWALFPTAAPSHQLLLVTALKHKGGMKLSPCMPNISRMCAGTPHPGQLKSESNTWKGRGRQRGGEEAAVPLPAAQHRQPRAVTPAIEVIRESVFPNITGCWRGAATWLFSATQSTVFTINNNSKQKWSQKSKLGTLELRLCILILSTEIIKFSIELLNLKWPRPKPMLLNISKIQATDLDLLSLASVTKTPNCCHGFTPELQRACGLNLSNVR